MVPPCDEVEIALCCGDVSGPKAGCVTPWGFFGICSKVVGEEGWVLTTSVWKGPSIACPALMQSLSTVSSSSLMLRNSLSRQFHSRARQTLLLTSHINLSRNCLSDQFTSQTLASVFRRNKRMAPKPKIQEPVITAIEDLSPTDSKWVTLRKISYIDQTGTPRTWEVASRKTRARSAGIDAVAMGNVLLHPSRPPSTLIVIQYRPPLDAYTVEWPAGLVDEGETPEQAAVREFREETGYECRVVSISPVMAADPGLSSANMKLVMVEARLGEGENADSLPEQRLEDGENIERVVIPLSELYQRLLEYSQRERMVVSAKLFHFAAGMEFGRTMADKYKI
jgi:ADP-ribose pyrophosphatase